MYMYVYILILFYEFLYLEKEPTKEKDYVLYILYVCKNNFSFSVNKKNLNLIELFNFYQLCKNLIIRHFARSSVKNLF